MEDLLVRTICRLIVPFVQMYGFYVITHGHLSPGGGFAGGAIVGASMILFAMAFNLEAGSRKLSHDVSSLVESGGAIGYVMVGFVALLLGRNFLTNKAAGFPLGTPGNLFSSGIIFFLSIAIGFKVASTMVTLFYNLIERSDGHGGSV